MAVKQGPSTADRVGQVASSTLIVIGGSILSFAIGLVRQSIVAHLFGITADFDAYTAADGVSELLVVALASGTLVYAFTPLYIEFLEKGARQSADRLASLVANTILILAALAALAAALFAPTLVAAPWGLGPGFPASVQALIVGLLRVLMLSTIIFTLSSFVTGVLHAHQHFWLPAISPAVYYGGVIFGALVLAPHLGIYGLAWGAVIGASFHLLVQVPGLVRHGVRWNPYLDLRDPALRRVLALMAPRVIDLVMARASITWLGDNLSSYLGAGKLSALGIAYRVMNIPWTLIGTALGFAIFPVMAAFAAQNDISAQRRALSGGLRAVLMFTIPAAVGLLILGKPLIQVLFEGGQFTAESTDLVYFALQFYMVALISQSMLDIVVRAFAAQQDTWTPLYVSFFTTAINVGLAIWLTRPIAQGGIEHGGPALANGLAVGIEAIAGLVILHIRWRGVDARRIVIDALRACAASLAMAGVLLFIQPFFSSRPLLMLVVGGTIGFAIYLVGAYLFGIREIRTIPALVFQRAFRRNAVTGSANE